LAYLALACAVLLPVLRPPWSFGVAVASAVCGLLSALLPNWAAVEKATSTFLAKVVVVVVGVAALVVSPWIANTLVSETTRMRPSAFPNAYSAFQYMATLVLWAVLGYCALFFSAIYNVLQSVRGVFSGSPSYAYIEQLFPAERSVKAEIFSSLGRLAGLVVLLVYIAPMLFKEVNCVARSVDGPSSADPARDSHERKAPYSGARSPAATARTCEARSEEHQSDHADYLY